MVNVVGGVVVFTFSAVVPIVVAKAMLSLIISLMTARPKNEATVQVERLPGPAGQVPATTI